MDKKKEHIEWDEVDFERDFLPSIAIDTVILGVHENNLKVLLLQYKNTNTFALPGGFVFKNEDLDAAAQRVLKDRTSLEKIYLDQFHTFGDLVRHDTSVLEKIIRGRGIKVPKNHFLLTRFISVGYYALVDFTKVAPVADLLADNCKWYDLKKMPKLMQDHKKIVEKALDILRENLDSKLIGFNLLPDTFTMGELQTVYETILQTRLLRTSFQRKMIKLGILKKLDKKWTGGAHKAPYLYKFVSRSR